MLTLRTSDCSNEQMDLTNSQQLAPQKDVCRSFSSATEKLSLELTVSILTLNAPITTKVVCLSRLLKCLRRLDCKLCGPRSDCSYRSSLFWVHTVCSYTYFVSNVRQLFATDNFIRQHFQMHFILDTIRFNSFLASGHFCSLLIILPKVWTQIRLTEHQSCFGSKLTKLIF